MDCSKSITDQTVGEAIGCFKESLANLARPLGANLQKMQDQAASTTIGEWFEIAGAIIVCVAGLALVSLMVGLVSRSAARFAYGFPSLDETQTKAANRFKAFTGWFFLVAAALCLIDVARHWGYSSQSLVIGVAVAFFVTAFVVFMLRVEWWAPETSWAMLRRQTRR